MATSSKDINQVVEGEEQASSSYSVENSSQDDVLDWLNQDGNQSSNSNIHVTPRRDNNSISNNDIAAGVQAVMHIVPAVIRALNTQPETREAFYELTGVELDNVDPEDTEAWPAIIGAIASALPAIITSVSGAVNRNRSHQGQPRRPSSQSPVQQPITPQQPTHCPPGTTNQTARREEETLNDAEALPAALIPLLIQLVPLLIPLITQVFVPMLTKSLPMILNSLSGKTKATTNTRKKEVFEKDWEEEYDGAWKISEAQIESLWEETSQWVNNPEDSLANEGFDSDRESNDDKLVTRPG